MRSFVIACGGAAIGAATVIACATSEANDEVVPDSGQAPGTSVPEAAAREDVEAGTADASVDGARCSTAGWCETVLPDANLGFFDIWPFDHRAFAIATSETLGIRILEWTDAASKWQYIDDATQNEPEVGPMLAGKIWAPTENEVYFGAGDGYVYHGTRPDTPSTTWSWTRVRLPYDGPRIGVNSVGLGGSPLLGIWGTSSNDVYAWYNNSIFHWSSVDGGAAGWNREYVADDIDAESERLFFVAAAGSGPDDVWFSGARFRTNFNQCPLVVRKHDGVYQRIADCTSSGSTWAPRGEMLLIAGTAGTYAQLSELQAIGPGQLVGSVGRDVVRISVTGQSYVAELAPPLPDWVTAERIPLWASADTLWLGAGTLILRGTDLWTGGGYAVSSLAINGAPLSRLIYQVRGTSNSNLWAVGGLHAHHKTTP